MNFLLLLEAGPHIVHKASRRSNQLFPTMSTSTLRIIRGAIPHRFVGIPMMAEYLNMPVDNAEHSAFSFRLEREAHVSECALHTMILFGSLERTAASDADPAPGHTVVVEKCVLKLYFHDFDDIIDPTTGTPWPETQRLLRNEIAFYRKADLCFDGADERPVPRCYGAFTGGKRPLAKFGGILLEDCGQKISDYLSTLLEQGVPFAPRTRMTQNVKSDALRMLAKIHCEMEVTVPVAAFEWKNHILVLETGEKTLVRWVSFSEWESHLDCDLPDNAFVPYRWEPRAEVELCGCNEIYDVGKKLGIWTRWYAKYEGQKYSIIGIKNAQEFADKYIFDPNDPKERRKLEAKFKKWEWRYGAARALLESDEVRMAPPPNID
ncbi:hypothetical protein BXZ70DRAFT_364695 [Cristinia sonorae]|uniref:Uncharacterized protein n=1 Tax=Cristinia sonorae TaxID=1940300 RepID=A0A8K0ULE2_9AGAR|nr:hypothetical protein BXZ70DRAFT_364695 [Cristinia sonorae]